MAKPSDSDTEKLLDETAEDGETLKIGIGVSPNGSMTLELFEQWIDHFLENCLHDDQGKGTCLPRPRRH